MAQFGIVSTAADPLGLAAGVIVLVDVTGGPRREYHESLNFDGVPIIDAIQILKPTDEISVTYELQDTAALTVPFGVALNTDWLVTSCSSNHSNDGRPSVSVTAIKPSAADKIKAYLNQPVNKTFNGGFGVVDLHGNVVSDAISSTWSLSMQTSEAMEPTSGDFLANGIYHFGFKEEVTINAYSEPTIPANANATAEDDQIEARDAFKTFSKTWWRYLDSVALQAP